MSAYLRKAAFLAAETPQDLCPTTDLETFTPEHGGSAASTEVGLKRCTSHHQPLMRQLRGVSV